MKKLLIVIILIVTLVAKGIVIQNPDGKNVYFLGSPHPTDIRGIIFAAGGGTAATGITQGDSLLYQKLDTLFVSDTNVFNLLVQLLSKQDSIYNKIDIPLDTCMEISTNLYNNNLALNSIVYNNNLGTLFGSNTYDASSEIDILNCIDNDTNTIFTFLANADLNTQIGDEFSIPISIPSCITNPNQVKSFKAEIIFSNAIGGSNPLTFDRFFIGIFSNGNNSYINDLLHSSNFIVLNSLETYGNGVLNVIVDPYDIIYPTNIYLNIFHNDINVDIKEINVTIEYSCNDTLMKKTIPVSLSCLQTLNVNDYNSNQLLQNIIDSLGVSNSLSNNATKEITLTEVRDTLSSISNKLTQIQTLLIPECAGIGTRYYVNGTNTISISAGTYCSYSIVVLDDFISITEDGITSPFNYGVGYSSSKYNYGNTINSNITITGLNANSKAEISITQ